MATYGAYNYPKVSSLTEVYTARDTYENIAIPGGGIVSGFGYGGQLTEDNKLLATVLALGCLTLGLTEESQRTQFIVTMRSWLNRQVSATTEAVYGMMIETAYKIKAKEAVKDGKDTDQR